MNTHVTTAQFAVIEKITDIAIGTWYYIGFFLLFCTCRLLGLNKWANVFLFILLSLVIAGCLCEILKIVLGRPRPDLYINHHIYGFQFFELKAPMHSFPSGHTVNMTSLMIALSFLFPRYWLAFISIAITLGMSRIVLDQHFLSDVIFGMYISMIMVSFLYKKVSGTLIPEVFKL